MVKATIKLNSAGVREILKSGGVASFLLGLAEGFKAEAAGAVTIRGGQRGGGDSKRKFTAQDMEEYQKSFVAYTVQHPTRVVARYGPSSPYAWIIAANQLKKPR